jgi:hypothetical protein
MLYLLLVEYTNDRDFVQQHIFDEWKILTVIVRTDDVSSSTGSS